MICPTCNGNAVLPIKHDGKTIGMRSCADCLNGFQHCCEGERPNLVAIPGYWMHETSGVLRPAIEAYLAGGAITGEQIAAMRAYLRQWIMADGWHEDEDLAFLRRRIDDLTSRATISAWLASADEIGIDPL